MQRKSSETELSTMLIISTDVSTFDFSNQPKLPTTAFDIS